MTGLAPHNVVEAQVIDKRFELTSEVRVGGMAQVFKARDLWADGSYCAIKRMLPLADELLAKESFQREFAALEMLQHKNIVRMITYGIDDDRRPYIVMEWVESDLERYVEGRSKPMDWPEFWHQIGRPLLEALSLSQSRRWVHRDIKPKNILIDLEGEAKLTDYGIARFCVVDVPLPLGRPTFRDHGSKPFTPPETDEGAYAFTRDGFSWGVIVLYCLTGRIPADYADIGTAIEALSEGPIDVLLRACSLSPSARPQTVALLLQQLDDWEQNRSKVVDPQITCWIHFPHSVQTHLSNLFGPEERDPVTALLADLAGSLRVRAVANDPNRIRLIGDSWQVTALRDPTRPGVLIGERAVLIGSAEAERQKDNCAGASVSLKLGTPPEPSQAAAQIDELFAEAQGAEQERTVLRGGERERIVRVWQSYLRARSEFESSRASALRYTDRRVNGKRLSLTIADPIPLDLLGQDRLIRVGQRYVYLEVVSVLADEVTLEATSGDPSATPPHGQLEVNTVRAERAIERQRQALDAVSNGRSVNPFLREIVLDGRAAKSPLPNIPIRLPAYFDDDKVAVLGKAIGIQDILAVEGPPGTGKTRLIEEIVSQYLERNPRHRVLLSSQTHAALDNVIERLRV